MKRKEIKKLEKEFSIYVRKKGFCDHCWNTKNLQLSHILPKGKYPAIRLHPLNALCLCFHCHLYWWHKNPVEAWEWLIDYIEKERLDWVHEQIKAPSKVPDVETVMKWWKEAGWIDESDFIECPEANF